ncbi:hypothetical protein GGR53DRAFT_495529 [Hypoxylon sp. FL1150]|nr:hypothetical protein GGR53DRAFT_495529 [Hypoxylon sp. FL1150]
MPMTWNDAAERDLLLAMLMNTSGTGPVSDPSQIRVSWLKVVDTMTTLGYDTSKDAVSQRWGKRMLPSWKDNYPSLFSNSPTKGGKATKATKDAKGATAAAAQSKSPTPAKRKRATRKAACAPVYKEEEEVEQATQSDNPPAKKKSMTEVDASSWDSAD